MAEGKVGVTNAKVCEVDAKVGEADDMIGDETSSEARGSSIVPEVHHEGDGAEASRSRTEADRRHNTNANETGSETCERDGAKTPWPHNEAGRKPTRQAVRLTGGAAPRLHGHATRQAGSTRRRRRRPCPRMEARARCWMESACDAYSERPLIRSGGEG